MVQCSVFLFAHLHFQPEQAIRFIAHRTSHGPAQALLNLLRTTRGDVAKHRCNKEEADEKALPGREERAQGFA
ncbi:MAG: hypothetical protein ACOY7P_07320, partial [Pseudomonadota bacterium]